MLAFATLPIGILYILKLAAIEQAVGVPSAKGLHERAALLEGPATGAEAAPLLRGRER
jgi:hypothetical protein